MNNLHKKEKSGKDSNPEGDKIPQDFGMPSTSELYYKKLSAYLLLLYQSYLRRETVLEPEIKLALWRMVRFNEEFRSKIRGIHLDYFQKDIATLDAPWELVKDSLFPIEDDAGAKPLNDEQEIAIREYKDAVNTLLSLHS
ncbi:MAG: hypothetical protein KJN76_01410 [Eudoraea sp.]|nr:hypothetical protein [Eudoraea sp.]